MPRPPRVDVAPGGFRPARGGREQLPPPRPISARFGLLGLRLAALLPYPVTFGLAGVAGWVAARLPLRTVRVAEVNIATCLPELSNEERRALLLQSTMATARAACEVGPFWMWPRDRVLGLVRDVRGIDVLERAFAAGRGVVLAGPHLGAWELGALYCSSRFPVTGLYRRPVDPALDAFLVRGRTRFGGRLVSNTASGIRTLIRALGRGEVIGVMPDQDPRRGAGVFVPFFGVPANTTTLVSRLVQRTGAALVLAFAERLPKGAGFRLHFREASPGLFDADVVKSATALNADIERLVRDCPEQYLWSYKRFSVRPQGQRNPYRQAAHAEITV